MTFAATLSDLIYGGKNVDEEGDSRRRWVSFLTFLRLFIRYCFILRGLLVTIMVAVKIVFPRYTLR